MNEDRGPEWAEFYAACARAEIALDAFERRTRELAQQEQDDRRDA